MPAPVLPRFADVAPIVFSAKDQRVLDSIANGARSDQQFVRAVLEIIYENESSKVLARTAARSTDTKTPVSPNVKATVNHQLLRRVPKDQQLFRCAEPTQRQLIASALVTMQKKINRKMAMSMY